jgi:hypothetical protein
MFVFGGIPSVHTYGEDLMGMISPDEFDVDLAERRVTHRSSGIWFSFYEYLNEDDWLKSDSVTYRDNSRWEETEIYLLHRRKMRP